MEVFTKQDIIEYNNVFEDHDLQSIFKTVQQSKWHWGHESNTGNRVKNPPFWNMHLGEDRFFTEYLFKKIINITGDDLMLGACYANAHTYGLPGDFHIDGTTKENRTFIFYAVTDWNPRWNGKTAFQVNPNEYHFVMPAYNKAVYFPGLMPHMAEEPTRTFGGLRITVVWKARLR